jgi:hypothetical protein
VHRVTGVGDRGHTRGGIFREQTKHLPQVWTIPEMVRVIGITVLRDLETGGGPLEANVASWNRRCVQRSFASLRMTRLC